MLMTALSLMWSRLRSFWVLTIIFVESRLPSLLSGQDCLLFCGDHCYPLFCVITAAFSFVCSRLHCVCAHGFLLLWVITAALSFEWSRLRSSFVCSRLPSLL
jgi:hypothetical protein